jgi:hypothetical protein
VLEALQRGGGCLARPQRRLHLDQGVARGSHGGVGNRVILGPAGLIQVGDDEGVAAPPTQAQVQQQGAAAVQCSESSPSSRLAASREVATITGGSGNRSTREPSSIRTPRVRARASSRASMLVQPPIT